PPPPPPPPPPLPQFALFDLQLAGHHVLLDQRFQRAFGELAADRALQIAEEQQRHGRRQLAQRVGSLRGAGERRRHFCHDLRRTFTGFFFWRRRFAAAARR